MTPIAHVHDQRNCLRDLCNGELGPSEELPETLLDKRLFPTMSARPTAKWVEPMTRSAISWRVCNALLFMAHPCRSGKVRIEMTMCGTSGHLGRFFASWRLGVLAFSRRATGVEGRTRGGVACESSRFGSHVSLRETRSPNLPAPAKPAGASLFDSQPFERGLAEPQRWATPNVL